jgi:hypothetical protein
MFMQYTFHPFLHKFVVSMILVNSVFESSRVQISARSPAILTSFARFFFPVSSDKCRDITLNCTTPSSFQILSGSFIFVSFDAVQSELLVTSLNEPQTDKIWTMNPICLRTSTLHAVFLHATESAQPTDHSPQPTRAPASLCDDCSGLTDESRPKNAAPSRGRTC